RSSHAAEVGSRSFVRIRPGITDAGVVLAPLPRRSAGDRKSSPSMGTHIGQQEVVLLAACGAPREVGPHPCDLCVGVGAVALEVDEAVELVEALLARDLGPAGPEHLS